MSVRTTREEIFLVERRDVAEWSHDSSAWAYYSRHKTARAARRAREAAIRKLRCGTRQVRVVRVTIETRTEVLVNQEEVAS